MLAALTHEVPSIVLPVFPLLRGATGIWITAIFAEALSVLVALYEAIKG